MHCSALPLHRFYVIVYNADVHRAIVNAYNYIQIGIKGEYYKCTLRVYLETYSLKV